MLPTSCRLFSLQVAAAYTVYMPLPGYSQINAALNARTGKNCRRCTLRMGWGCPLSHDRELWRIRTPRLVSRAPRVKVFKIDGKFGVISVDLKYEGFLHSQWMEKYLIFYFNVVQT